MTVLVPRLSREAAEHYVERATAGEAPQMPDAPASVTFAPLGGDPIDEASLRALREEILGIASDHGFGAGPPVRTAEFEGRCARAVHRALPMTPHEASQEEVWSYLTCCWLIDVAVWRFSPNINRRRLIGDVNRNTFRRMWWRAEILGPDIDLTLLGEDELVNIMERPTLSADRRLARTVAAEHLSRVQGPGAGDRMLLMREATKRLLRLTPFVAFTALDDQSVVNLVSETFDAAAAGIAGERFVAPHRAPGPAPAPSPELASAVNVKIARDPGREKAAGAAKRAEDFEVVAELAMDLARRTGRVTNATLREVVPITPEEGREVFAYLMSQGRLVRRGVKRGTHYVQPESAATVASNEESPTETLVQPAAVPADPPPSPRPSQALRSRPDTPPARPVTGRPRSPETALRRLLRRGDR